MQKNLIKKGPRKAGMLGPSIIAFESKALDYDRKKLQSITDDYIDYTLRLHEKVGKDINRLAENLDESWKAIGKILWNDFSIGTRMLFTESFDKRMLDCDTSAYLMADVLGLSGITTQNVSMQGHMILKLRLDEDTYYAETTDFMGLRIYSNKEQVIADYQRIYYELDTSTLETLMPTLLYHRANKFKRVKRFDEALHDYSQSIELNPGSADVYNNRGNLHKRMGRYKAAIHDYDRAIEINPYKINSIKNRGWCYETIGDLQRALKDYDTLADTYGDHNAYFLRGKLLLKTDELDRAVDDLETAAGLRPKKAEYKKILEIARSSVI